MTADTLRLSGILHDGLIPKRRNTEYRKIYPHKIGQQVCITIGNLTFDGTIVAEETPKAYPKVRYIASKIIRGVCYDEVVERRIDPSNITIISDMLEKPP